MSNVFSIQTGKLISSTNNNACDKNKEDLLEIIDIMRSMIEHGSITSLVATSTDDQGEFNIHASAMETSTAVGLYEIGKAILLERNMYNDPN